MKKYYLLPFILITFSLQAQIPNVNWFGHVGGSVLDQVNSITLNSENDFLITGYYGSNSEFDWINSDYTLTGMSGNDAFLAKYTNEGIIEWAVKFGGNLNDGGGDVAVDNSNNVYSVGTFTNTGDFDPGPNTYNLTSTQGAYSWIDIYISKLDTDGNFVFAKQIMGEAVKRPSAIKVDAAGNFYVVGYYNNPLTLPSGDIIDIPTPDDLSLYSMFIIKFDTNGDVVWYHNLGEASNMQRIETLDLDANGNLYIGGQFHTETDFDPGVGEVILTPHTMYYSDMFILKLDADGNFVWVKQFGGDNTNSLRGLKVSETGDIYATGYFYGMVDFDPNAGEHQVTSAPDTGYNPFLFKLDNTGSFQWVKDFRGNGRGYAVSTSAEGQVFLGGDFNNTCDFSGGLETAVITPEGDIDGFIAAYDAASGDMIWVKTMGSDLEARVTALDVDQDGALFAVGSFDEFGHISNDVDDVTVTGNGMKDGFVLKISEEELSLPEVTTDVFYLYPNPVSDLVSFHLPNDYQANSIKIYNLTGQLVHQERYQSQISLKHLASGLYIMQLENNSQKLTVKLVKQ
ncbi:T9SS type A sorting domain-containing protein [Mangrovimonas sp. CR14]|uniref:T9SS type A sorting domain-containing protein n=1 Tax=Mangrovimonas sp. CR14 TaxID=2706120 RepID=UPI0014224823|nr:T9SS type A sorting domain-containing protein [Mangrovimonas sp. CR14]NIK91303.1 T9SS type A sorting domain-containing protein [Mangrovimonas sp. CR14]